MAESNSIRPFYRKGPITMRFLSLTGAIAGVTLAALPAFGAPTPIPGGAYQISAVSGTVRKPVWNGVMKMTVLEFRTATPEEASKNYATPNSSQKAMFFRIRMQNGSHDGFNGLMHYTLADKDAISVLLPDGAATHPNLAILQGAAQVQDVTFDVDKDFVPVKLIAECVTCGARSGFRPVRFTLPSP